MEAKEHHTPNAGICHFQASGELTRRQTLPPPDFLLTFSTTPAPHTAFVSLRSMGKLLPCSHSDKRKRSLSGDVCFLLFSHLRQSLPKTGQSFPRPSFTPPLPPSHAPMLRECRKCRSPALRPWEHNSGLLIPTSHRFHHLPHIYRKRLEQPPPAALPLQPSPYSLPPAALPTAVLPLQPFPCNPLPTAFPLQPSFCSPPSVALPL